MIARARWLAACSSAVLVASACAGEGDGETRGGGGMSASAAGNQMTSAGKAGVAGTQVSGSSGAAGGGVGQGGSSAGSGAGGSGARAGAGQAGNGGAAVGLGGMAAGGGDGAGRAGAAGSGGGSSAGTSGAGNAGSAGMPGVIAEELTIANVWSGHPVGFFLLTHEDRQFVAFYDEDRALTIGERTLGKSSFKLVRLPTSVGWDSHNDIVMAVDDDGFVHVSGNMHSSPLVYFRTAMPLDIDTFEPRSMVGMNEQSCTYPQFFRSPSGELIYMYRDGSSGNGNHIFNAYSTQTKAWRRLLGSALTDGEGQRNAYPVGPIQGPAGDFHLVWVWRDTPDAATNHDLSYARTADLLNWTKASGQALTLPIRLSTGDVVDDVPAGGGMINNNTKVGFDAEKRPIVAYHKFDSAGNTQLYNARFENGAWVVHRTSSWNYRWEFGGGGTLVFEIEVEPVVLQSDGTLTQNWYHARNGGLGAFRLDPDTLAALETIPQPVPYPEQLAGVESATPEMQVRWRRDAGSGPDPNVVAMLRWETLPSNRDMPRPSIPPATPLKLYAFRVTR